MQLQAVSYLCPVHFFNFGCPLLGLKYSLVQGYCLGSIYWYLHLCSQHLREILDRWCSVLFSLPPPFTY